MDPLRAIAGRKVLVTGGTGTLGGAFGARAREAGAGRQARVGVATAAR